RFFDDGARVRGQTVLIELVGRDPARVHDIAAGVQFAAAPFRPIIGNDIVIANLVLIVAPENIYHVHKVAQSDVAAALLGKFAQRRLADGFTHLDRAARDAPFAASRFFAALDEKDSVIFKRNYADAGD